MENKFKFKKGDLEIEISGEKEFVELQISAWKNHLLGNDSAKDNSECSLKNNTVEYEKITVVKNISLDDFIKLKNPSEDYDKLLVGAYYLEKYEKYTNFTEMDLHRLLKLDDVSSNLEDNLIRGFITTISDYKNIESYTITYAGEMYIKNGLQL